MTTQVLTIGHSTHSIDVLLRNLQQHSVTAVADVRSAPYSRFNPQFNRDALERNLKDHRIKYVFLGRELGARSDDSSCYEGGKVQYRRLARTEEFRTGIERLISGAMDYRIALLCAEKEPLECHRTILVAPALQDAGIDVVHILADGTLERHRDTMDRLLDLVGLPREDLLRSHDELVAAAMARQEQKIAYVDSNRVTEAPEELR